VFRLITLGMLYQTWSYNYRIMHYAVSWCFRWLAPLAIFAEVNSHWQRMQLRNNCREETKLAYHWTGGHQTNKVAIMSVIDYYMDWNLALREEHHTFAEVDNPLLLYLESWLRIIDHISKVYFSHWKPPGVTERMWSVNLDASISGESQTLGGHSCQPSE